MVHTGGLFTVIGNRPANVKSEEAEINIYSICSKFPDSDSGDEIAFDGEIRVHLMDG